MGKKTDPRHKRRVAIVKDLFAYQFNKSQRLTREAGEIIEVLPKIDKLISKYAPEWPLSQISAVDLSILRLAIFELVYQKAAPYKVAVDEAVEIAKEFGSQTSYEFVNGVLGTIIEKELKIDND